MARRSKYGNRKVTRAAGDGAVTFDSKAEASYYDDLLVRQRAGEIRSLELQPTFPVSINGVAVCKYKADFRFQERTIEDGGEAWRIIVVDVKGVATAAFRLKWKLVQALYPHLDWRLVSAKEVRL